MVTAVAVFLTVASLQVIRRFLTKYVPLFITRSSNNEKQLVATLREQKNELLQINAQHEFAKYAKLKRQISKREDEIRSKEAQRQKRCLKIKGVMWVVGLLITVFCHSWVIWTYRTLPLATLPSQWLSPLNRILRFPTSINGAIGLPAWLLISNSVIFQFLKILT